VLALRDGIYRARSWRGPLQCIVAFRHGEHSRFNDGKADPLGRFLGRHLLRTQGCAQGGPLLRRLPARQRQRRQSAGGAEGHQRDELQRARVVARPAHPVLGRHREHTVHAWDWEGHGNAMRHHRTFHQLRDPKPAGWQPGHGSYGGRPDGAAVDQEGHYWVALFEGGRLLRLVPDGRDRRRLRGAGALPHHALLRRAGPAHALSHDGAPRRPAAELAALPDSGCVLAAQVEVPGLPVNFFID
jgi:sugar lactone lactonase YvrE